MLDSLENERGDEARASATDTRPARDTATRRSRDDASVDDLLRRLRSGPPEDEEAFREIARAPKRLLPELIRHVSSKEPTRFYEIHALALHDDVVRRDESDDRLYYFVKGMGRFYFDDVAAGLVFGGRGTRVEFRSFRDPFPLGVVLRAALLYRFKSEAYPDFADEERDIARWWRTYYERSEPRL
ncbi:MAG TPA: hypothetical protein VK116_01290 [Planctomycetota bacterium]|nr:hypothetical protein [Planctomycetota bacterium]